MTDQATMFDPRAADVVDLLEHLGDDVPPMDRWPKTLAELFAVFEAAGRRAGMDERQAALHARDYTILVGDYLGARQIYLPKGDALRTAALHALMWREFNGRNVQQLAERYGINEINVYEILRVQRAAHARKLQGRLFD